MHKSINVCDFEQKINGLVNTHKRIKVCDFEHRIIGLVKSAFVRKERNDLENASLFLKHNGYNCDFEFELRDSSANGFKFVCKYKIEKEGRRVSISNATIRTRNDDICVYPKDDRDFECKLFEMDLARYIMRELEALSF